MKRTDSMEVFRLSRLAYVQRILYFSVTTVIVIGGTIIAIDGFMAAPLDALYVLPVTILLIALGVNTGYHMCFTHHSFDTAPAFRYLLAYLESITCQDSVAQWVSNHKRHHRHTDSVELDPHTPRRFGDDKRGMLTLGLHGPRLPGSFPGRRLRRTTMPVSCWMILSSPGLINTMSPSPGPDSTSRLSRVISQAEWTWPSGGSPGSVHSGYLPGISSRNLSSDEYRL